MGIINKSFALAIFAALLPHASLADSGNPMETTDDEWRFTVAFPMLWAPSINGKIRGSEDVDFSVSFNDILEDLKFGIMGELYANRGPYGLALRVNYLNVADKSSSSDSLTSTDIETDLTMGVNDLLASWRVHDKVRLVTGVRHVHAKFKLKARSDILGIPIIDYDGTLSDTNSYDLLLGINFDHWFDRKWGVMLNADVGVVGDNDRDYSLEFRALYRISELNNFWFGYRYLNIGNDTKQDGVEVKVDMTQLGPTLGWAFTF